jgi:hypothetical protein
MLTCLLRKITNLKCSTGDFTILNEQIIVLIEKVILQSFHLHDPIQVLRGIQEGLLGPENHNKAIENLVKIINNFEKDYLVEEKTPLICAITKLIEDKRIEYGHSKIQVVFPYRNVSRARIIYTGVKERIFKNPSTKNKRV